MFIQTIKKCNISKFALNIKGFFISIIFFVCVYICNMILVKQKIFAQN